MTGASLFQKEFQESSYAHRPTTPASIKITNVTTDTLHVAWQPPSVGAALVRKYIVMYTSKGMTFESKTLLVPFDTLSVALTNLHPDTSYNVSVAAADAGGQHISLHSDTITIVTDGVPPVVHPYRASLSEPIQSDVKYVLVCLVDVHGWEHTKVRVSWMLDDQMISNRLDQGSYRMNGYFSFDDSHNDTHHRMYIMTLHL
jgi:hypothetical protein